jgi:hypothetical protein
MDMPHLRSDGVRSAAQHPLHGGGWACGSADLEPIAPRICRNVTLNLLVGPDCVGPASDNHAVAHKPDERVALGRRRFHPFGEILSRRRL